MRNTRRLLVIGFIALAWTGTTPAQGSPDFAGHWEGTLEASGSLVRFQVDLVQASGGAVSGTISIPAERIVGLPLSQITRDGATLVFGARSDQLLTATLSTDRRSMSGTYAIESLAVPFTMTRTGEAILRPTPRNARLGQDLEGSWHGTLEAAGLLRLELHLTNLADGKSTATLVNLDEGRLQIPMRLTREGEHVRLNTSVVPASYAGALNAAGTELTGAYSTAQGTMLPLTFRRAAAHALGSAAVLDHWARAVGGRDRIGAIHTVYREATIEVGGFMGSIKAWHTADGKFRKEERVASFSRVETFDGTAGTVQQGTSPARAMTPAEIERARSTAFANFNAVFFAFFPERQHGTVVLENGTVVLRRTGGIDWRVILDPRTSLPVRMTHHEGDRTVEVTFVAYETVDGVTLEREIHRTNGDPRFDAVIRFTRTAFNPPIDSALFAGRAD